MRAQTEPMVFGTPELMEAYAAVAAGVADQLARQAVRLQAALDRLRATSDRALVGGLPAVDAGLRSMTDQITEMGAISHRVGVALKTADRTDRMDTVFMTDVAFRGVFAGLTPGGSPPAGPPSLPPGSPTTIDGWRRLAYERAGVDVEGWDPTADMVDNDARIQAIWDRYGQLYLLDPEHFRWAGMAKLAGATVYAGMMDLRSIVGITDAEARRRALRQWITAVIPGFGDDAVSGLLGVLIDLTGAQLDRMLGLFQQMEQAIADDLLWQHEVYRVGGLAALEPLLRVHGKDDVARTKLIDGWRAIDHGDPIKGSRLLVDVEQNHVLHPWYEQMRSGPAGLAFTELLTLAAESPVPGGRPYREAQTDQSLVDRLLIPDFDVPPYRRFYPGELDNVAGNVADRNDRWAWVEQDLYPTYVQFLAEQPEEMARRMRTPVAELADRQRRSPIPYERR